jgi:hypothetical protein
MGMEVTFSLGPDDQSAQSHIEDWKAMHPVQREAFLKEVAMIAKNTIEFWRSLGDSPTASSPLSSDSSTEPGNSSES